MRLNIILDHLPALDNAGGPSPEDYPVGPDLLGRGIFVIERKDLRLEPEEHRGLRHVTSWGSLLEVVRNPDRTIERLTFGDIGLQRVRAVEQPTQIEVQGDMLLATDHAGGEFIFRPLVADDARWIAGRPLSRPRLLDAICGIGELAAAES